MTQTRSETAGQRGTRRKPVSVRTYIGLVVCVILALVVATAVVLHKLPKPAVATGSHSTNLVRYLGVDESDAPNSYGGTNQFARAIGRQPNIAMYYESWLGKFHLGFASAAAQHGAIPLVQISTGTTSLASIASGSYDYYWRSYANHVKSFGQPVILSLDHEMNGSWYFWGYKHTSPQAFVDAWRHIVTIFRQQGVRNVTWLWTVNVTDALDNHIHKPSAWWPGDSYVDWVGIDGYYYGYSETFASLFGPTIANVRELTHHPILIAETGATLAAGQPDKIAELFQGVRRFGLLGFVLFDQNGMVPNVQTWHIGSRAAFTALHNGAKAYMAPPRQRNPVSSGTGTAHGVSSSHQP